MKDEDYHRGFEWGLAHGRGGITAPLYRALVLGRPLTANFQYWNGYITGFWFGQAEIRAYPKVNFVI